MEKEKELRPIPEYPGYFVNDIGEVWSTLVPWNCKPKGKIKKLKPCTAGYGYNCLGMRHKSGEFHRKRISRLVINAPPNKHVDHINGIRSDDRIENLRLCNRSENLRNQKIRTGETSKFKGVSFSRHCNLWRATIVLEGKQEHLGYFKDEEKAYNAYDKAAVRLFGEFAKLNSEEL